MIHSQRRFVKRNCRFKKKFPVIVILYLFLLVLIIRVGEEIRANELSTMKALVQSSQAQRIFDTNETTILIGKNAEYGPPESDKQATYELWMLDIQTKTETRIKTQERVIEASLSPVGGRIACITESYTLWVTDSSGEHAIKLYEGVVSGGAWSPDGSKLAFAAENPLDKIPNPDIFVAETKQNSVLTQLTTHISDDDIPAWSPDGRQILFVSGRTGIASLWIIQVDGSNLRQVTNKGIHGGQGTPPEGFIPVPVFDKAIVWPDQGKIYFHSGDELWMLQGDQTTSTRSLISAKTVIAKKIKTTEFPAGLFTVGTKPALWLKEENAVNIMNLEQ